MVVSRTARLHFGIHRFFTFPEIFEKGFLSDLFGVLPLFHHEVEVQLVLHVYVGLSQNLIQLLLTHEFVIGLLLLRISILTCPFTRKPSEDVFYCGIDAALQGTNLVLEDQLRFLFVGMGGGFF